MNERQLVEAHYTGAATIETVARVFEINVEEASRAAQSRAWYGCPSCGSMRAIVLTNQHGLCQRCNHSDKREAFHIIP